MFFSEHSVEMGFWANKITDYRAHCCHTPAYCVDLRLPFDDVLSFTLPAFLHADFTHGL